VGDGGEPLAEVTFRTTTNSELFWRLDECVPALPYKDDMKVALRHSRHFRSTPGRFAPRRVTCNKPVSLHFKVKIRSDPVKVLPLFGHSFLVVH
jgi:hypothetical protein